MIDPERRAELERRRQLAALRAERQRLSATFRSLAPRLCEAGVRFSRLSPAQGRYALGRLALLPGQDERLLVGSKHAVHRLWQSDEELVALVRDALAGCASRSQHVAMIFHTHEAGMKSRAAALAFCAEVLTDGFETVWIVAAEPGDWLIEISYVDREVAYQTAIAV